MTNKWVATLARGVTHSPAAVPDPLMTINVNGTISAWSGEVLSCRWAAASIGDTYLRLIQAPAAGPSFSASVMMVLWVKARARPFVSHWHNIILQRALTETGMKAAGDQTS